MKRVTKIKRSPMIVQAIENEGCETIYWVATTAFIHYEDGDGSTDKKHQISTDGKLYRKLENSDHPGVVWISTVSPTDFTVVMHCFEPIDEVR